MTHLAAHLQHVRCLDEPAAADTQKQHCQNESAKQMSDTVPAIFSPGSSPGIASTCFQAIWPFLLVWFYLSL